MSKKETVKARIHHGTNSLDITIPTKICRDIKINEGDLFTVEVSFDGDNTILKYTRVFENK